jgi:hypothetical protein
LTSDKYSNTLLNNRILEYFCSLFFSGRDPESVKEVFMDIPGMTHLTSAEVTQLDPYVRKMAWLIPRLQRAVSYLGYILIIGEKPATAQGGAVAQAREVAEGITPERMS